MLKLVRAGRHDPGIGEGWRCLRSQETAPLVPAAPLSSTAGFHGLAERVTIAFTRAREADRSGDPCLGSPTDLPRSRSDEEIAVRTAALGDAGRKQRSRTFLVGFGSGESAPESDTQGTVCQP